MQTETHDHYEELGIEIKEERDVVKVDYEECGADGETVTRMLSSEVDDYKSIMSFPSEKEEVRVEASNFTAVSNALDSLDENWEEKYTLEEE